jgi:2-C-methyl-D-erythritol 4-phosphate cytidylyltransferase
VIPEDEIPYCQQHIVTEYGFNKIAAIVAGGKERQNSVMNGLRALQKYAADDDVILIHDGVRPLISENLLFESIQSARLHDGALVAVPVKDTIKTVQDGIVRDTPQREMLWQAQTPQAFRFGVIFNAHLSAEIDGFSGTDDASLVERNGGKVHVIAGDYRNIKITTPEDLILAEAFLSVKKSERA